MPHSFVGAQIAILAGHPDAILLVTSAVPCAYGCPVNSVRAPPNLVGQLCASGAFIAFGNHLYAECPANPTQAPAPRQQAAAQPLLASPMVT